MSVNLMRLKAALITLVIATVVPLLVFILFTNPGIIFTLLSVAFASFIIFLIYLKIFLMLKEAQERNATKYQHDVTCNADRSKVKWTPGSGCSCSKDNLYGR